MKIKLSKSQWELVGKKAGWMKISGTTNQLISTVSSSNGNGIIVSILGVDSSYGNTNFLQSDESRWLYTEMIRNRIDF